MSGWRRLWIVLSVLFGAPVALLVHGEHKSSIAYIEYPEKLTQENSAPFWALAGANERLSNCDWPTAKASPDYGGDYRVTCDNKGPWDAALLWGLLPAALMAAIGLTARWIYRGFKPSIGPQTEQSG